MDTSAAGGIYGGWGVYPAVEVIRSIKAGGVMKNQKLVDAVLCQIRDTQEHAFLTGFTTSFYVCLALRSTIHMMFSMDSPQYRFIASWCRYDYSNDMFVGPMRDLVGPRMVF
jgi:hypothetical protein